MTPPRSRPAKRTAARSARPVGAAVELVGGRARQQVCYGTYAGDMPEPGFRLRVAFVEHADSFKMHAHEYSEICVVLGGRATHLTDYENHPLEAGDVFVISDNTRHGFQEPQGLKLCNVMFDPRQFLGGQRDLDRMMGYHALFDLIPRSRHPKQFKERLHLTPAELAHVTSLVTAMHNEMDAKEEGWQTVVRNNFLLLAAYLSRLYTRQKSRHATPLVRMANVVSHIQKNFRQPLSVEELARLAHLSASQFQRTFKRTYNTTPVKFINQVRIHEACELLKDPNHNVTSVAMDCGYSSSAFFSTQFKSATKESPSAYRRRHVFALSTAK